MSFLNQAMAFEQSKEGAHAMGRQHPCKGVTNKTVRDFFEGAGLGVSSITKGFPASWVVNITKGDGAYRAYTTAARFSQSYPGHEILVDLV